jgi:hypothetical protein
VAADGTHLYWVSNNIGCLIDCPASPGDTTIARANVDGTAVNLDFITPGGPGVTNVGSVTLGEGLAVSNGYIYWGEIFYGDNPTGAIARANLDGSGQTYLKLTSHPVLSLTVDGLDGNQVPLTTGASAGGTGTGSPGTG